MDRLQRAFAISFLLDGTWISGQHFELAALQRTFEATLFAHEQALARLADLDKEITALADTECDRTPVAWLRSFRGIEAAWHYRHLPSVGSPPGRRITD